VKYLNEEAHEAICSVCGRSYWVTEAVLKAIKSGKVENICAYCDKTHDDN